MKILHIIPTINPVSGGPIEGVLQMAKSNRERAEYHIASLDLPNQPYAKDFPIRFFPLGESSWKYGYSKLLKPWLTENVKNYDGIIINGLWQFHSYGAISVLKNFNVPILVYPHGMLDKWFNKAYPIKFVKKQIYWLFFESKVISTANALIYTTQNELDSSRFSFYPYRPQREVVSGYGTHSLMPSDTSERERIKHAFYLKNPHLNGKKIILFLGRINPKKGIDILLEAFRKVLSNDHSWALLIVGPFSNEYKNVGCELLKKYQNECRNIFVKGFVAGEDKIGCYLSAKYFILPSHQENFGIAVAEALSCALPVAISNKVNIFEEVVQGNAGYVGDDTLLGTIGLIKKISDTTSSHYEMMTRNAESLFFSKFQITQSATNILNLIEKMSQKYDENNLNFRIKKKI